MMNASRPLVTPEELQCLLGWPIADVQDSCMAEAEPLLLAGRPASALVPGSGTQVAGLSQRA